MIAKKIAPKSRPVRNLVSRSHAGISTVLSSTGSSTPENFGSEIHVGLKASTGRPIAKRQNSEGDTMWNSQEWHTDARSMASTEKPVAWNSNQMKNSRANTGRPVTQNPVTDIDLETSRGYNLLFAESVSFSKRLETRLRVMLNRPPGDKMEDIDKHCRIW